MRTLHAVTAAVNLGAGLLIYALPAVGPSRSVTAPLFLAIGALYLWQALRGRRKR